MRAIIVLIFLGISITLQVQTNPYLTDLNALRAILQKTPSYKDQIKGDRLTSYNNLFEKLSADTISNPASYKYFYNLSQLFFLIRDNHLSFYQIPDYNSLRDRQSVAHPHVGINIDSLRSALTSKSKDSIEGIYHYDRFYTVGLYKYTDTDYLGVILHSDSTLWQPGQVAMYLHKFGPNLYKAIYAHPLTKNFIYFPVERYNHQSLVNSIFYGAYSQRVYSKNIQQTDHVNIPASAPLFEFRNINNNIQYIRIGSFQRNNRTIQRSGKLYDTIKDKLTGTAIILDLRNQEGGAELESRKYLKLLQKFMKKGHVYVLANNGTVSQAEMFILKLRKNKQATIIGETTKGMLTYGSNYGKRERLPSGRFEVYLTDMKGKKEYLEFEDYGVDPDVILRDDSDWTRQVVEIIQGSSR